MSWFLEGLRNLHIKHEKLKHYVHNKFRYPLPPAGRYFMGFVYFCIPVVSGWHLMQWAIAKSHDRIGEYGEKLPVKTVQGIGDQRVTADGKLQKVGAGGWGGGVHLAVSNEETQERNRVMLHKFLRQQRRKMEKEKAKSAETAAAHTAADDDAAAKA